MAGLRLDTAVPNLPPELRNLFLYLLDRDGQGPLEAVVAMGITTTSADGWDRDVIEWTYNDKHRIPDGFIVACSGELTEVPDEVKVLVSAAARKHAFWWPTGHARSYAVAGYRNTYQGEKATAFAFMPEWLIPEVP